MGWRSFFDIFYFSKREKALAKLLRDQNGALTSRDIFDLEFGENLPDIIKNNKDHAQRRVHVQPIHKDKSTNIFQKLFYNFLALGYVHGRGDDSDSPDKPEEDHRIYLNSWMFSLPGRAVLGGLIAKAVTGISVTLMAPFAIGKALIAGYILNPFSSGFGTRVAGIASAPIRSKVDVLGHEHLHDLQKTVIKEKYDPFSEPFKKELFDKQNQQGIVSKFDRVATFKIIRRLDNILSEGSIPYFCEDVELQARLHTIIAHGAHRWRRLPENKHQLWQGLLDAGLHAPKSIHEKVERYFRAHKEQSVVLEKTLSQKFKRAASAFIQPDVAEINTAHSAHYKQENKEFFWEHTLPYMYGHMLELYGDPDGRVKMGYDQQVRPSIHSWSGNRSAVNDSSWGNAEPIAA